ncbi:MAG TPA: glutathione S-transferase [Rhodocyclaceae bacterium]|nr:glutathione S-transferase [Rhodocyclaceae bacterium]
MNTPGQALPILYSFRRCPYAMRARLAIAASGQAVELREVVLKAKPVELLTASPKGTVPVLIEADGKVIEESLEIMRWALEKHDPEGWLAPDQGAMLALIAECDGGFKHHLDRYKYPERFAGAVAVEHREAAGVFLLGLNQRLQLSAYLFGEHPTLADMAVAPFVRQFAQIDAVWFATQPWPRLRQWLERLVASPRFTAIMDKYAPWQSGTPGIRFPPVKPTITLYEYTSQPPFWIAHDDDGYWLVPARDGGWAERHPFVGHVMNLRPLKSLGGVDLGLPGGGQ